MAAPESAPHALKPAPRWRLALVLFCLLVVGLLAAQVLAHGPMLEADAALSQSIALHREAGLTRFMALVSHVHQTKFLLLATAFVMLWRGWRRDWRSLRALVVVPVGMLLNAGLKEVFQRARPGLDDPLARLASYSFPSGHAAGATVFYGMLCALVFTHTRSRVLRAVAATVAAVMILLVCTSRVYLGAHFASDVIAGVAEGVLCVVLFLRLAGPVPGAQPSSSG